MPKRTLPAKEIDLALLIFIERYASSLSKWDILVFFGQHPDKSHTAAEVAIRLGRSLRSIRPELGELALHHVLERNTPRTEPTYRLTRRRPMRTLVIKFAGHNHRPD